MRATAKELRTRGRQLIDAVGRGEEVTITHRGKPAAKLIPLPRRRPRRVAESPAFGLWKDHPNVRDVGAFVDSLRRSRH